MNLTTHQIRTEARHHRNWLLFYAVVLVATLGVALGDLFAPELVTGGRSYWRLPVFSPLLFAILFWATPLAIVAKTISGATPVNRERFLATRPFPSQQLLIAKALFLLGFVLLPMALLEAAVSALGHIPLDLLLQATTEMLLTGLLAIAVIATFTAGWATAKQAAIAGVLFGVTASLATAGADILGWKLRRAGILDWQPHGLTVFTFWQGACMLALSLSLVAYWRTKQSVRLRSIIPVNLAILGVAVFLMVLSPWREFPLRSETQTESELLRQNWKLTGPVETFVRHHDAARGQTRLNAQIRPHIEQFPRNWSVAWQESEVSWRQQDHLIYQSTTRKPLLAVNSALFLTRHDGPPPGAVEALREHYQGRAVVIGAVPQASPVQIPGLSLENNDGDRPEPYRIQATLAGPVYAWEAIAELPLQSGARNEAPDNRWRVEAWNKSDENHRTTVFLRYQTLDLHTSRRLQHRAELNGQSGSYAFALVFAHSHQIWWNDSLHIQTLKAFNPLALKTYGLEIKFGHPLRNIPLPPDEEAWLYIFRPQYMGTATAHWTSPETYWSERSNSTSVSLPRDQEISPAEFAQWFHEWKKIAPATSRSVAKDHLLELLEHVALTRGLYDRSGPAVRYAAEFVPDHIELFLDWEERTSGSHSLRRFIHHALILGLRPEQKDTIISRLPHRPALETVIIERGWLDEAKGAIEHLVNSPGRESFFKLLAWQQDPETYPLLADTLQNNPRAYGQYEWVRILPGMEPYLESLVEAFEKDEWLFVSRDIFHGLGIGLAAGNRAALERLYWLIELLEMNERRGPHLTGGLELQHFFALEDLDTHERHDNFKVLRWLKAYSPDDLLWDPIARKFVRRSELNTAKTGR